MHVMYIAGVILTYCMNHPFLNMKPPKSTGREQFGEAFVTGLLNRFKSIVKKIYWQLSRCLQQVQLFIIIRNLFFPYYEIDEVILGGGGSYNRTLVEMIRFGLKEEKCKIFIQENLGYSSAAKEAIAFAVLANETYYRNPSNVPSATGAKNSVVLGNVTFPQYVNENEANI